jgi:hypothetical protein
MEPSSWILIGFTQAVWLHNGMAIALLRMEER